jgi:ubiquinone/menaquinone biosynthesis C-methylase UbiE
MSSSALRDKLRENLLPYTRMAFHLLPPRECRRILDIGCGTGVPTLLLANLAGGEIVGLDQDAVALEVFRLRMRDGGLEARVSARQGSLEAIPFPDGSFDLLWCEGALWVLGFGESLRRWRRLLAPGGWMVAHDDAVDIREKMKVADAEGFVVHAAFVVPEEIWWRAYYAPAEAALLRLAAGGSAAEPDHNALTEEIHRYRATPETFRSAYFVLERAGSS